MNSPRISVVVPSYNQGRFLRQCLDSIVSQGYENLELIIIDGGSTDESVSIIKQYEAHIAYWQSEPDGGQSAAINIGMARASGEIIAWLNSDDLYTADTLRIVADVVKEHPGHGLYIGNGLRLDERTGIKTPFIQQHVALNRHALKGGIDYIQQPSVFFARSAWNEVGGLNQSLNFCMDWDIFIRIADRYSVVAINEFLSMSREYEDTKTASGGLRRAAEIIAMTAKHANKPVTVGGVLYFLETLLQPGVREEFEDVTFRRIYQLGEDIKDVELQPMANSRIGVPTDPDEGDTVYLPIARMPGVERAFPSQDQLPVISIVIPSFNQGHFIRRTLESIIGQNYPNVEIIVMDGGSTDGTVEILQEYDRYIAHWESEADRGPAHAINKGFARATGSIMAWLASDDMYAKNTLWIVGQAFLDDPDLSMLVGNALYVDEADRPKVMDHGDHQTAFYYGRVQPREMVPAYWLYVHSIPQPSTFFTKSLLKQVGALDEKYKFIFDFELFFRMVSAGRVLKVERTLSFYRIHDAAKTSDWNKFLVELYSFSRPWWPNRRNPEFLRTLRSFTSSFMKRTWGGRPQGRKFRLVRLAVAALAATRMVNVEKVAQRFARHKQVPAIGQQPKLRTAEANYHKDLLPANSDKPLGSVLFCSYFLPKYPGFSGGEIRDFHILQALQQHAELSVAVTSPSPSVKAQDILRPVLAHYFDYSLIGEQTELVHQEGHKQWTSPVTLLARVMNRFGVPIPGSKYHFESSMHLKSLQAYVATYVRRFLREHKPQFLVVSPQSNGLALLLEDDIGETRTIMASYDVEAVRLERLALASTGHTRINANIQARRAAQFEADNLVRYDGVIAVSELDRQVFIQRYKLDPQRVAVVENGVDTDYFAFHDRQKTKAPAVVFVATMGYEPNHLAAMRLVDSIMPLVWKQVPEAQVWIVGQGPRPELLSRSDGKRVFVTGSVDSVRGYLSNAQVMCAPLTAGSGTKYKVLEALSAGVPSVCTALAIEGLEIIPDQHVKVADDNAGIAQQIAELIQNPGEAARLAANGRKLVQEKYAWSVALQTLRPWLEKIAQMPKASGASQSDQFTTATIKDEVAA
jgi:glycosyltransferase involved in cell wall biosynthesis